MIGLMIPSVFAELIITDDATGGDCSTIGTWDAGTRTCSDMWSVSEQITIGSNYITLDNGSIDFEALSYDEACQPGGPGEYSAPTRGIYLNQKTGIVVKDFTIERVCDGIFFDNSVGNSIIDNKLKQIYGSAIFVNGPNNTIFENEIQGHEWNGEGYHERTQYGIYALGDNGVVEGNYIDDHVRVGIKTESGLWTIQDNEISHAFEVGIYSAGGSSQVIGNTVDNVFATGDPGSATAIILAFDNQYASYNKVTGSITGFSWGTYAEIKYNDVEGNELAFSGSNSADIHHNNIKNNQNSVQGGANYHKMGSGNYWSDYSPYCDDIDYNNICDSPYPFTNDNFPWTVENGWFSEIIGASDQTLEAADSSGTTATYSVIGKYDGNIDNRITNLNISMPVTCDYSSNITNFPIGTTQVVCTAENGLKAAFDVTVNLETTPPIVTVPWGSFHNASTDLTLVAPDSSGILDTFDAYATDNMSTITNVTCSGNNSGTIVPIGTNDLTVDTTFHDILFPMGVTAVTCTAEDAAGNVGSATWIVTVNLENIPPTIAIPDDYTINLLESETESIVSFDVTATDNFAVTAGPTCSHTSDTAFPIGVTTVTCTAEDAAGNVGSDSFTVTILEYDTISPTIDIPSDMTISETGVSSGGVGVFTVTASDNIGVVSGPTCSHTSGDTFAVGSTTVTCTAEDGNGNVGNGSFIITVTEYVIPEADTIAPQVLVPENILVNTDVTTGEIVTFNPTAVDNVDELITPTCSPQSGSLFQVGVTTVVCTATDTAGNANTNSFTVTIDYKEFAVPNWVKDVAGFWYAGDIDDTSFLQGIQYLIQNDVIVVPVTESESEGGGTVPAWVKNNAGWWSQGAITDADFVNGIQFLIKDGLIQIN